MRVCVMVEGETMTWSQWLEVAQLCEAAGFDGLFRSDHYGSVFGAQSGSLDAWATIIALCGATSRIRLGTLVSPVSFRHPSELAKVVAAADHVSRGRVELGLGAGWLESEHVAYGFPFHDTRTRLELLAEQVEIIHRQWTEEVFDFHGKHYALERCRALPKPVQTPRPPIVVGGSARPGTIGPAVRFADEYNTLGASPERCRERRSRLDAACSAAGRDPQSLTLSVMTPIVLGKNDSEVGERAERIATRLGAPSGRTLVAAHADDWLIGTPTKVIRRLAEYEAAGVQRVFLQNLLDGDVAMLDQAGCDVLPALT
jgi:F420-dependent oxidoreductase-like protein